MNHTPTRRQAHQRYCHISASPYPIYNRAAVNSDDSSVQDQNTTHLIQLDSGVTIECDFTELAPTLPPSPSDNIASGTTNPFETLPYILHL